MITKGLAFVILVYFLIKRFTYIYILLVKHAYIYELTGTSRFCPTKFVKDFFCAKKAKTRNAFNKRFGKKPADGSIISFCFAILLQFKLNCRNLAGKRSINIGTLFNFGFG